MVGGRFLDDGQGVDGIALLPQGVAGGGEEGGVEGPADLQGQAALGAQLLGQCHRLIRTS